MCDAFGIDALSPDYTRGGVWAFGASRNNAATNNFNLANGPLATLFFLRLDSNTVTPTYNCNQLEAFSLVINSNLNNKVNHYPVLI